MRSSIVILLAASSFSLFAEAPKIDGVFPAGGQRGTEFEVSVSGNLDPWPVVVVCDEARVTFAPDEKQKGSYQVKIGAEVEPGAYLLRFSNADGVAAPRQFVVGLAAERAQAGSEVMTVPVADFPLTVNGKLESGGDVDRFAIELQAGQRLVADVAAYSLDSPLDPLLHVRGPLGQQLAFNHDATRLGLDPRLVFEAPAAGNYELQLSAFAYPPQANIRFAGGATSIYRLTLGQALPVIEVPPAHQGDGAIAIPAEFGGRIGAPGESHQYRFEAKQGETLHFEVAAAAIGSWMDPVLVIEDAAGKELKRQDDIDNKTNHDVVLDWSAPADGVFTAKVFDLNGGSGSEIAYCFRSSKPQPGLDVTATGAAFNLRAGEKLEIAVKVARKYGHTGELVVGVEGLPAGVSAKPVPVPEKGGDIKLEIEAAADAALANGRIRIWAGPKGAPDGRVDCQFELKGAFADAGDLLINRTGRAWFCVLKSK